MRSPSLFALLSCFQWCAGTRCGTFLGWDFCRAPLLPLVAPSSLRLLLVHIDWLFKLCWLECCQLSPVCPLFGHLVVDYYLIVILKTFILFYLWKAALVAWDGLIDLFAAATSGILRFLLLFGARWHEAQKQMAYCLEHSATSNSMLPLKVNSDCSQISRDFQASILSRFGLKSVRFGFFELSPEMDWRCCVHHL
jgi:hypothetical protein